MNFSEKLNEYIQSLPCTAKELSELSGLSHATLSRYRSGERIPQLHSHALDQLCGAIAELSAKKLSEGMSKASIKEAFSKCSDLAAISKKQLCENFNTLMTMLNVNTAKLCQYTNYDSSTIFRFRNGSRQPSEPVKFAADVSEYIAAEAASPADHAVLAELLSCSSTELEDPEICCAKIKSWLLDFRSESSDHVSDFLSKLDTFDLNEYIKVIHFDEMKLPPTMPFSLPTSKAYFGLKEMMESELDFLKATVLSRSTEAVTMYSDMPIEEMAKDPEFPRKWMFGMAMMLKKGLHLNQIHNLDRSFEDMMLGLESWIPMYMTGQISPYYLKNVQNNVFCHLIKVSGAAALVGEAISGFHGNGKYYLTKSKEEVAYYQGRAKELLQSACPLMDIYRQEQAGSLKAFLMSDAHTCGKRKNILSAPPLFTLPDEDLRRLLTRNSIPEKLQTEIMSHARSRRELAEQLLSKGSIEDEIPMLSREEFNRHGVLLPLSFMFCETDISYTYEEYLLHLARTREYAKAHPTYHFTEMDSPAFSNLQIHIHEGQWAMVSKGNSPAIHFVIHHPRLREAIEHFVPPVREA